jgi:hypothetical protein
MPEPMDLSLYQPVGSRPGGFLLESNTGSNQRYSAYPHIIRKILIAPRFSRRYIVAMRLGYLKNRSALSQQKRPMMSRGIQEFKQTNVTKAIRAAQKAGLDVQRFEIDRAGKITVIAERAAITHAGLVEPEVAA